MLRPALRLTLGYPPRRCRRRWRPVHWVTVQPGAGRFAEQPQKPHQCLRLREDAMLSLSAKHEPSGDLDFWWSMLHGLMYARLRFLIIALLQV